MNDLFLAIGICITISAVWYYISKSIAYGFPSREDMTIPIFLTGMGVFTLICILALIAMIIWWY